MIINPCPCLSEKTLGYRKRGIKVNGGRTSMGKWKEGRNDLIACKQTDQTLCLICPIFSSDSISVFCVTLRATVCGCV